MTEKNLQPRTHHPARLSFSFDEEIKNFKDLKKKAGACFGSTYTKIGTIQRRLAWPLRKDDTQIREAFHIKKKK